MTSIIRLRYLRAFATSTDETWDDQFGSLWPFAEESVAIICACMSAIRKLLSNYLPNIFDMGGSSNKNDVLQFSTYGETRPASLYPMSIVSVERRSKRISTILTGDENLRADAEGIPFRWSVDVSAEPEALA